MSAGPSWTPQQAAALTAVGTWLKDPGAKQVFRLFGYAGTGKTTLARHLAGHVHVPTFAAFTGKAASVLREKGCIGATTLHSLMYSVKERDRATLNALRAAFEALTPDHPDYAERKWEYEQEQDRVKRPWFHVNPESVLRLADLIIVDEVSMVDHRVGRDLESFGKKILVLGDPAQLPPVQGGGYFTNATPDVLLTEIHRQAADNPILRWATLARNGQLIPYGDEGAAVKLRRDRVDDAWLAGNGQILCGKNDTRRSLNERIRKVKGHAGTLPIRGDTLVMLMNDHKLGVLNGTVCYAYADAVVDEGLGWINLKYPTENGKYRVIPDVCFDHGILTGHPPRDRTRGMIQLDYGYALTVHKAQGSQWDEVVLYDDGFAKRDPDDRRRWLYTAITRAAKRLTIVTS
jgi:exodeoxyribonuclease-5